MSKLHKGAKEDPDIIEHITGATARYGLKADRLRAGGPTPLETSGILAPALAIYAVQTAGSQTARYWPLSQGVSGAHSHDLLAAGAIDIGADVEVRCFIAGRPRVMS